MQSYGNTYFGLPLIIFILKVDLTPKVIYDHVHSALKWVLLVLEIIKHQN